MGTTASVATISQEIAKPADGSDVAGSTEAATAEVVRLRALLREHAGKAKASHVDAKTVPQGTAEDEEKNSRVEVWHYNGTAKNARGQKFGDYNFRRVLFDYGVKGEKGTVTMDIEYIPASDGSIGGYRSRYVMTWDVKSGRIGNPGESWQGTLRKGTPGQPMDFLNKWKNILLFLPVKKLPASALLDEDNPGETEPPLTDIERAACASVAVPSGDCWTQAIWFIEKPIVPRKEEVALGEKKYVTARAAAHQWLLAALDVDEPVDEVVLSVKRLLSVRRFTVFLTPDQFAAIIKLTRRELTRIGGTLAKYYDAEGLQAKMGQLGKEAWENALPVRPRQHHYIPTPTRHCFYPQNSKTYETVSMSEYNYIFMLMLIGRGINAEFQARAGGAVERAVPGCMYSDAPTKSFHRMYNKLWYGGCGVVV